MILELLSDCGITPKLVSNSKGGEYHSPCPRSGCCDTNGFHAWPAQNGGDGSWWCRGCNKGGDIIEFMREYMGMSFAQAAARAGRDLKSTGGVSTPSPSAPASTHRPVEPRPATPPEELWREKAAALVKYANEKMLASARLLALLEARGINATSVARFKLGWVENHDGRDIFRPRESWGLPAAYRPDGKKKMLWIPRGITIPKFDTAGLVQRIRIRRDEADVDRRYYVVPGGSVDPQPLLFIPSTWPGRHQALVICETELDAILIAQAAGDLVGVLATGSASAKPQDDVAAAACESAAWIGVSLDADDAGGKALPWWTETYSTARDVRPDGVKDPGEMGAEGAARVREWIIDVLPPAWRVGLEKKKRGAAEKAVGDGVSADVKRMYSALKRIGCRMVLKAGGDYADIFGLDDAGCRTDKWQFLPGAKDIMNLFVHNREVEKYLSSHPCRTAGITVENFWEGAR